MDILLKLLGSEESFTLESRLLNVAILTTVSICTFISIELIILGALDGFLLAFISALIFAALYLYSRTHSHKNWLLWTFLLLSYFVLFIDWAFIGGSTGVSLPVVIAFSAIIPLITKRNQLLSSYLSLAFFFVVLVIYSIAFYDVFPKDPFKYNRLLEQLSETMIISFFLSLVSFVAINSFRIQKDALISSANDNRGH